MTINYIITCGISQLKFDRIGSAFPSGKKQFTSWIENDWTKNDYNSVNYMNKVVGILNKGFENEQPGGHNLLGAELSTLKLLRQKQARDSNEEEKFRVLASVSNDGQLAATILTNSLEKLGLTGSKQTVKDLDDKPDEDRVNPAMCSLVDNLYNSLLPKAKNKLIITGGFKSILPCITLFATLNGLEMYYLFEDSNCLQSLQPTGKSLKDPAKRSEWITLWMDTLYDDDKVKMDCWIVDLFDKGLADREYYG